MGPLAVRVRWFKPGGSLGDGKAGGDAVELFEQPLPRRVVVDRFARRSLVIAIHSLKHLEQGVDRFEIARVDRPSGELVRGVEPHKLNDRMIRRIVELLAPQGVGDDLADAPVAHPSSRAILS